MVFVALDRQRQAERKQQEAEREAERKRKYHGTPGVSTFITQECTQVKWIYV